jgi:hypothetical protein
MLGKNTKTFKYILKKDSEVNKIGEVARRKGLELKKGTQIIVARHVNYKGEIEWAVFEKEFGFSYMVGWWSEQSMKDFLTK